VPDRLERRTAVGFRVAITGAAKPPGRYRAVGRSRRARGTGSQKEGTRGRARAAGACHWKKGMGPVAAAPLAMKSRSTLAEADGMSFPPGGGNTHMSNLVLRAKKNNPHIAGRGNMSMSAGTEGGGGHGRQEEGGERSPVKGPTAGFHAVPIRVVTTG